LSVISKDPSPGRVVAQHGRALFFGSEVTGSNPVIPTKPDEIDQIQSSNDVRLGHCNDVLVRLANVCPNAVSLLSLKVVTEMAGKQEYLDAANKKPANRSAYEQGLVDKGSNMQDVKNADFEAKRQQQIYGK
jgi:hypothetical protein